MLTAHWYESFFHDRGHICSNGAVIEIFWRCSFRQFYIHGNTMPLSSTDVLTILRKLEPLFVTICYDIYQFLKSESMTCNKITDLPPTMDVESVVDVVAQEVG